MNSTQWHRFDIHGVKYICTMKIGEYPENTIGYTEWKRGIGPVCKIELKPKVFVDNITKRPKKTKSIKKQSKGHNGKLHNTIQIQTE